MRDALTTSASSVETSIADYTFAYWSGYYYNIEIVTFYSMIDEATLKLSSEQELSIEVNIS